MGRRAGDHAADGRLEALLSGARAGASEGGPAPWPRRMTLAAALEIRLLAPLAAPAVAVYMLAMATASSTQIVCGHLGNVQLAAASLGNNGIQLFAYGLMVRARTYSSVLVSHLGGKNTRMYTVQLYVRTPSSWLATYVLGLGLLGASLTPGGGLFHQLFN
jgi:MATE family multidrug resistance protein